MSATIPVKLKEASLKLLAILRAKWLLKHGISPPPPSLSAQQRAEVQECFDMLDTDNSGAIDVDEILAAFGALGFAIDKGSIEELMTEISPSGSVELGFDEFLSLMARAIYYPSENGSELVAATGAGGCVSFADAVRAFRRKKLIESLIVGGDARQKVVEFHEKVQDLIRAEAEELRQRAATHRIYERMETQRQEDARMARVADPPSRRAAKVKARLQSAIDESLEALEGLLERRRSSHDTALSAGASCAAGGLGSEGEAAAAGHVALDAPGASAAGEPPSHPDAHHHHHHHPNDRVHFAEATTAAATADGVFRLTEAVQAEAAVAKAEDGSRQAIGRPIRQAESMADPHSSLSPSSVSCAASFASTLAQRHQPAPAPATLGARQPSFNRCMSLNSVDNAPVKVSRKVTSNVLRYMKQLEESVSQQGRKFDEMARINAVFVSPPPDRSDFTQVVIPRPASRLMASPPRGTSPGPPGADHGHDNHHHHHSTNAGGPLDCFTGRAAQASPPPPPAPPPPAPQPIKTTAAAATEEGMAGPSHSSRTVQRAGAASPPPHAGPDPRGRRAPNCMGLPSFTFTSAWPSSAPCTPLSATPAAAAGAFSPGGSFSSGALQDARGGSAAGLQEGQLRRSFDLPPRIRQAAHGSHLGHSGHATAAFPPAEDSTAERPPCQQRASVGAGWADPRASPSRLRQSAPAIPAVAGTTTDALPARPATSLAYRTAREGLGAYDIRDTAGVLSQRSRSQTSMGLYSLGSSSKRPYSRQQQQQQNGPGVQHQHQQLRAPSRGGPGCTTAGGKKPYSHAALLHSVPKTQPPDGLAALGGAAASPRQPSLHGSGTGRGSAAADLPYGGTDIRHSGGDGHNDQDPTPAIDMAAIMEDADQASSSPSDHQPHTTGGAGCDAACSTATAGGAAARDTAARAPRPIRPPSRATATAAGHSPGRITPLSPGAGSPHEPFGLAPLSHNGPVGHSGGRAVSPELALPPPSSPHPPHRPGPTRRTSSKQLLVSPHPKPDPDGAEFSPSTGFPCAGSRVIITNPGPSRPESPARHSNPKGAYLSLRHRATTPHTLGGGPGGGGGRAAGQPLGAALRPLTPADWDAQRRVGCTTAGGGGSSVQTIQAVQTANKLIMVTVTLPAAAAAAAAVLPGWDQAALEQQLGVVRHTYEMFLPQPMSPSGVTRRQSYQKAHNAYDQQEVMQSGGEVLPPLQPQLPPSLPTEPPQQQQQQQQQPLPRQGVINTGGGRMASALPGAVTAAAAATNEAAGASSSAAAVTAPRGSSEEGATPAPPAPAPARGKRLTGGRTPLPLVPAPAVGDDAAATSPAAAAAVAAAAAAAMDLVELGPWPVG